METTKLGSASKRITMLLARNLVVWIYFITVPIGRDPLTGAQIYSEYFSFIKLFGFIFVAYGILIFN